MQTVVNTKADTPFAVDSDGIFIARTDGKLSSQARFEKLVAQSNGYAAMLEFVAGIAEMPEGRDQGLDTLIECAKLIVRNRV